ncbi:MAG: ATP-binding protein [Solirubrobacterales bacterium]
MSAAVSLRLPARPENVAVVRQALTGLGDAYDLDPELLGDIKTAVTEACNNVVLHAYPDTEGLVEVEADCDGEYTDVIVRDFGAGIQPRGFTEERSLGLGLPLIATLSTRFEIRGGGPALGLEVDMTFSVADARERRERAGLERGSVDHPFDAPRAAGLLIQPGPLVASVASRVTAILAARADFPLDRLADAVLVSDAIAAHASDYISGSDVGLVIEDGDGTLDFRVGPLHEGGGEGLLREMEVPGLGHSLERLVDEVKVERGHGVPGTAESVADAEFLSLRIGKAHASRPATADRA